jgi:hypothetical protein
MTDAPTQYLPILVRDGGVTEWERKFCASLIAQQRRGRATTPKQAATLQRIVAAFQDRVMREETEIIEAHP